MSCGVGGVGILPACIMEVRDEFNLSDAEHGILGMYAPARAQAALPPLCIVEPCTNDRPCGSPRGLSLSMPVKTRKMVLANLPR